MLYHLQCRNKYIVLQQTNFFIYRYLSNRGVNIFYSRNGTSTSFVTDFLRFSKNHKQFVTFYHEPIGVILKNRKSSVSLIWSWNFFDFVNLGLKVYDKIARIVIKSFRKSCKFHSRHCIKLVII